jgi:hypothetical protein
LSSQSVGGYKTIRDKLISHNELRLSQGGPTGYDFYDVKKVKLKYGDERRLLSKLQGGWLSSCWSSFGVSILSGERLSESKRRPPAISGISKRRLNLTGTDVPSFLMHVYEVRPRKDKRGVDLISDALPFGRLWYVEVSDCEGRQDSGDLTWRGVMNQHGV